MSKQAIGYVRVSTEEQAREGVSLAAQEERIRAYCVLAGLELIEVVREEGVSGAVPLRERPGGQRLSGLGRRSPTRHVVALKLDRLFRDAVDALTQASAWDKAGVAMHLVDMGGQTVNTASAIGRFFLGILAGCAELERNLIGERTALALAHKKSRREAYSPTPFGFRRVGDRLEQEPAELTIVERIKREAPAGKSLNAIARELRRDKTPTKKAGGLWYASTVRAVLRNSLHAAA